MINTITLNPALDKILYIECFEKNVTNRIKRSQTVIGGKGTHVSVNLSCLGVPNRAFGVCHGATGQAVMALLKEAGIETHFIHREGSETRLNFLIVEKNGDSTIVADQGVSVSPAELTELINEMNRIIGESDELILSGDLSNCQTIDVYDQLFACVRAKRLKTFVDTSGPSLLRCLAESPYMIKPNLAELSEIVGKHLEMENNAIKSAIDSLERYAIEIIAVSLGGAGSFVRAGDKYYRVFPPHVPVANTIGCGDAYLAGFTYGDSVHMKMEELIRFATAVSAATAESCSSVGFDVERAKSLIPNVVVKRL